MIVWSEDQLDFKGNQHTCSLITFRDNVYTCKTVLFTGRAVGLIYHVRPAIVPRLVSCIIYLQEDSNIRPNTTLELI